MSEGWVAFLHMFSSNCFSFLSEPIILHGLCQYKTTQLRPLWLCFSIFILFQRPERQKTKQYENIMCICHIYILHTYICRIIHHSEIHFAAYPSLLGIPGQSPVRVRHDTSSPKQRRLRALLRALMGSLALLSLNLDPDPNLLFSNLNRVSFVSLLCFALLFSSGLTSNNL